ncbi:MAG: ComEC/Rec2 family competence protein [Candidatus Omnitrophica bacterium]|nr:ComEC/Rec2 family competence protein [Candidatus Omnitrophota bacterium]
MKYLLSNLCISFCLGIFTAASFSISFFIFFAFASLFLLLSIVFLRKNILFNIVILCAAFFLGAALLKNTETLPGNHIAKRIPYKQDNVSVTGVIDSDPSYQERNISFILRVEKLKTGNICRPACGKVLVKVYQKGEFSYGDRIVFTGKVYRPFSFSKDFDYRRYLKYQGIYSILSINKTGAWEILDRNAGHALTAFSLAIKHKIQNVFAQNLSQFSAGVLNAFILGDRQNLPRYIINIMVNLGVVHIIAISGFNVSIVAGIILIVLKVIRIPRRPRYLLTIVLLIIHCILTGANPPVVRATIMAVILLLGFVLEREVNIFNSLALAALIILVINPWQALGVSFQLSFLSVISIVWLTPKIEKFFPKKWLAISWARFFLLTFSVSFAAWFGLMPLIAYYFKIVTPIAVFANMIIVPYATLLTVWGISLAMIGLLVPGLAPILGASNELVILIFFKINYLLAAIPGAYFKLPQIPLIGVLLYYGVVLAGFSGIALFAQRRALR